MVGMEKKPRMSTGLLASELRKVAEHWRVIS